MIFLIFLDLDYIVVFLSRDKTRGLAAENVLCAATVKVCTTCVAHQGNL